MFALKDAMRPLARRHLEENALPLAMVTRLWITLAVLLLCWMADHFRDSRTIRALATRPPIVVGINESGRLEALNYSALEFHPEKRLNQSVLVQWAELYYGRHHETIRTNRGNALFFFAPKIATAEIEQEQLHHDIANFERDHTAPYVDVHVKQVVLDDLSRSPYQARIEFTKTFHSSMTGKEEHREEWVALVTYEFHRDVQNGVIPINPFGLTIIDPPNTFQAF